MAGAAFAIVTLLTGAPGWSVAVLTIAWSSVDVAGCLFYYRYFIPDRLEAAGDVILVETRLGGRRELASSELTFRLYRWNQFGGSFAWSSRARPRRSHAVFLTEAQVEYLADALDQARGTP